ncbi:MAG TPA: nuclear transport factor 2 family protein [Candidatus Binatia bacterium]|nr:nuclear transport factor 2 family protein [Candidatus Binatia bacterium]
MTIPAVPREVRQDVAEVLVRYATGIDRRDWALFRTCFTEDCHADYGDIGVWNGVDAITDFMAATHAPMGHTLHRITNQAVSPNGSGVAARSYVDVVITAVDGESGVQAIGFYDDELVPTAEGWKIARRRYTMVRMTRFSGS